MCIWKIPRKSELSFLFWNPNWLSWIITIFSKKSRSREYIIFSKTSDRTQSKDTGRSWLNNIGSSDIYNGITLAMFNWLFCRYMVEYYTSLKTDYINRGWIIYALFKQILPPNLINDLLTEPNYGLWSGLWWCVWKLDIALRWRHNGRDSVSNHQPQEYLLNCLFRRRSKKTSKPRVTGLCVGNSPGTGEFTTQMASNAENVSI